MNIRAPEEMKEKFNTNVRISNGLVIEHNMSRKRIDEISEGLSSIPSYAGSGVRRNRDREGSPSQSQTNRSETIDSDMIVALDHAMNYQT